MKNLYALAGILAILFLGMSSIQDNTQADMRVVVINFPDSAIHARVLIAKSYIKPDHDKIYYWYTSDCINANQGGFSGYLLHGDYSVYDNEQRLIAKGTFAEGLKTGIWKRWYPNGNMSEINTWKNGSLNGTARYYDQNGKQIRETKFKNGVQVTKRFIKIKKHEKSDNFKTDSIQVPADTTIMNQAN
jgi:hypothetical protein